MWTTAECAVACASRRPARVRAKRHSRFHLEPRLPRLRRRQQHSKAIAELFDLRYGQRPFTNRILSSELAAFIRALPRFFGDEPVFADHAILDDRGVQGH